MKYVRFLLGWLIVLVVVVLLGGTALLQSRAVGLRVAAEVENMLSEKLGTRVEIGETHTNLGRILSVSDVRIYDQQDSLCLSAERLEASLGLVKLLRGEVLIKHVSLINPTLLCYALDTLGTMNYSFALDSLKSKDDSPSLITVNLRTVTVSSLKASLRLPTDTFNISKLSLSARLSCMQADSLNLRLRNLSAEVEGGPVIESLRGSFSIGCHGGEIKGLDLRTRLSRLTCKSLKLGGTGRDGSINLKSAYVREGNLEASIAPGDLSFLLPQLETFGDATVALRAEAMGEEGDLRLAVNSKGLKSLVELNVRADYSGGGLTVKVGDFALKEEAVAGLCKLLPERPGATLLTLGEPRYRGEVFVGEGQCRLKGQLETKPGTIETDLAIRAQNIERCSIGLHDFDASSLLGVLAPGTEQMVGKLTAQIDVAGSLSPLGLKAELDMGEAQLFDNTLTSLCAGAQIEENDVSLDLKCTDPRASLSAAGQYNLEAQHLQLLAEVDSLSAADWGLSDDTLHTSYAAQDLCLEASLKNGFIPDMLSFRNLQIRCDTATLQSGSLCLQRSATAAEVRYTLSSDIADGEFQGNIEPTSVLSALTTSLRHYLPSAVSRTSHPVPRTSDAASKADFYLTIKDLSFVETLLNLPLHLQSDAHLTGYVSEDPAQLNLTFDANRFLLNGGLYTDATLFARTRGDSLRLLGQVDKLFGEEPVKFVVRTASAGDQTLARVEWVSEQTNATRGTLNLQSLFARDSRDRLAVDLSVGKSIFSIKDTLWTISPARIEVSDGTYRISNFRLSQGKRYLSIETLPVATPSEQPALSAAFEQLDLGYIFNLLNFHPVRFEGLASGTAQSIMAAEGGDIAIDLRVAGFHFNTADMGTLYMRGLLDLEQPCLTIDAVTRKTGRDSTIIQGIVDIGKDSLDLSFGATQTNLRLLNQYLGKIMDELRGACTGRLRLYGPTGKLNLTGAILLDSLIMRPHALNTPLIFDRDTVHFEPDRMVFDGCTIRDNVGGMARVAGAVTHRQLRHFGYDLRFDATRLLVYDWSGDETTGFWGTVRASGQARLYGDEDIVTIDADVRTTPGSSFAYDASAPEDFSSQPFIRFKQPSTNRSAQSRTTTKATAAQTSLKDDRTDIYINLQIAATPDAELQIITDKKTGEQMNLRGTGNLTFNHYNKGRSDIYGIYTLTSGNYNITIQDLIHRRFEMQPGGTLSFNGPAAQGDINMQGAYRINSVSLSDLNLGNFSSQAIPVNCLLNFTGSAGAPQISFDLSFPSSGHDEASMVRNIIDQQGDITMQAVYLLTVGRFYTYNYSDYSSGSADQSTRAMQSILAGTLSNQINRVLQNIVPMDNWTFGTNIATGRYGWDDLEVEAQLAGRLFGNRLLVSGNLGYRDNSLATYANDFVGDFNAQYFLNRARTIALKAYTETSDRYFTHSTLVTSGAGVLFNRDFTKLKYFFSNFWKQGETTR